MDRLIFSELVGAIYDAAVDQSLWPRTLGMICNAFGFRKGTIDLNRIPEMTNIFNYHYGIDAAQAARMIGHYRVMPEVWGGLGAVMTRPIDRPWVVSRILSQETLRNTEYYHGWVQPMKLIDGAAIVLARGQGLFGSMRLATDATVGIIGDSLTDALSLLLPHCQRAARINGLLDGALAAARDFHTVIDNLPMPVVLVSSECAIVHANHRATALLQDNAGLCRKEGRLTSSLPGVAQAISDTLRRLARDETDIPGGGGGLVLRAGDEEPRLLHILPLSRSGGGARLTEHPVAVAAIFVADRQIENDLPHDLLRSMFGMTAAEIQVLELLVAGNDTREMAVKLGVAVSTIRTHLLHLFGKTDTHHRTELVNLASRIAMPIVSP